MSESILSTPSPIEGNRRSASRWLAAGSAAMVATLGLLGAGCIIVDDGGYYGPHYYYEPGYYDDPVWVTIDADEVLETTLGEGAGVFVEYESGGLWRIWTACDTNVTGYTCLFDVYATAGSSIDRVATDDLEAYDQVDITAPDALVFYTETGIDYDGIAFQAEPGAWLELEVLLDGAVDPRYIFWVSDGAVQDGAPGSPVIFEPDEP